MLSPNKDGIPKRLKVPMVIMFKGIIAFIETANKLYPYKKKKLKITLLIAL